MRFVRTLKIRLSSASSPIWVLVNSNHLMLGLEYARQINTKVSFSDIGDTDLSHWRQSLRISITRYCSRSLILPILRHLLSRILWQKRKPILYAPHLSMSLFSRSQLSLLRFISKLDLISYYDDGMTLVSNSGILWKENLLPTEQRRLIGWNYTFRGCACPELCVSIASAYSSLAKSFAISRFTYQSIKYEPYNNLGGKRLIIASKWLDWEALDKLNTLDNPVEYCYVKHYRQSKNNLLYEKVIDNWDAAPNLELSLPSNISSFSHCYFGVTSTILFVLDVLLHSSSTIKTMFVPLIDKNSCDHPEEAEDFMKALSAYSDRLNIDLPG